MSTTAALQTHRSKWPRFAPSATRAPKSVRPTQPEQILMAGLLGAKSCFQLVDIPRVILHRQSTPDQTYYILGLPASSKYPIPAICQLRLVTTALARQSRVRVRRGFVRVIAPRFTMEVHRRVAGIIWRRCRLTLSLKTLMARPGFDQCSVDAEVLVRKQVRFSRLLQYLREELLGDITLQEPIPILCEYRRYPYRLV